MPSTTTYKRGQVLVVEVPFSDLSGTKSRPVLAVSVEKFHQALPDVIVCPISSQARGQLEDRRRLDVVDGFLRSRAEAVVLADGKSLT